MQLGVQFSYAGIKQEHGSHVMRIDASKTRTLREFYIVISKVLGFPGKITNPDAFNDIVEDYDDYGVRNTKIVLIIDHAEYLFIDEIYRGKILRDHFRTINSAALKIAETCDASGYAQSPHEFSVVLIPTNDDANVQELIWAIEDARLPETNH